MLPSLKTFGTAHNHQRGPINFSACMYTGKWTYLGHFLVKFLGFVSDSFTSVYTHVLLPQSWYCAYGKVMGMLQKWKEFNILQVITACNQIFWQTSGSDLGWWDELQFFQNVSPSSHHSAPGQDPSQNKVFDVLWQTAARAEWKLCWDLGGPSPAFWLRQGVGGGCKQTDSFCHLGKEKFTHLPVLWWKAFCLLSFKIIIIITIIFKWFQRWVKL